MSDDEETRWRFEPYEPYRFDEHEPMPSFTPVTRQDKWVVFWCVVVMLGCLVALYFTNPNI